MSRMLRTLVIVGSFLVFSTFVCAQDEPKAQVPEDAFSTRELIAWSSMQKPRPAPQPLPPADKPVPEPDSGVPANSPNSNADSEQPLGDAFIGRIAKAGETYVLTVSGGTTYQLASERDLAPFENKTVRLRGQLEAKGKRIRVTKVEVLS